MRKRGVAVIAGAAVLAVGSVGAVAGRGLVGELRHPRDVDAFYAHLQAGGAQSWDETGQPSPRNSAAAAVEGHMAAALAEGDRACAWLQGQPDAPDVDPSGRSRASEMARAYIATAPFPELDVSVDVRQYIVTRAWSDLCWVDRRNKTSPQGKNA